MSTTISNCFKITINHTSTDIKCQAQLSAGFKMFRPVLQRSVRVSCPITKNVSSLRFFHASRGQLNEAKKARDEDVTMRIRIAPIKRTGESLDQKRARLVYQSRKRGILETDLLLSRFAAKYLKEMTPEQLEEYDELLNELDWDIYYWATENFTVTPLPDRWKDSPLLKQLQEFSKNKDREILSMPDLSNY